MDEREQALTTYAALLAKVDAKFAEIAARCSGRLSCGAGCHGCCSPGLTVSAVEAEALRRYLEARPELVEALQALKRLDPHAGSRCSMLGGDGRCRIYEARPLVCRSHGVPLEVRMEAGGKASRSVCPLNFVGEDLAEIDLRDLINVDTLNTILALLNQQYAGDQQTRTELTITKIIPAAQTKTEKPKTKNQRP